MKNLATIKSNATNANEFLDPNHIKQALAVRAIAVGKKVFTRWSTVKASTQEKQNDLLAIETNVLAKCHVQYKVYESARDSLEQAQVRDPEIKRLFMIALTNFALKII